MIILNLIIKKIYPQQSYVSKSFMLINSLAKLGFCFFISSKKFQAKIKAQSGLFFTDDFDLIGIFTPGKNFPCFNLLSSTIQSISSDIPKKFKEVVAFAGDP